MVKLTPAVANSEWFKREWRRFMRLGKIHSGDMRTMVDDLERTGATREVAPAQLLPFHLTGVFQPGRRASPARSTVTVRSLPNW